MYERTGKEKNGHESCAKKMNKRKKEKKKR